MRYVRISGQPSSFLSVLGHSVVMVTVMVMADIKLVQRLKSQPLTWSSALPRLDVSALLLRLLLPPLL